MSQASPTIGANKNGLTYRQEDNDGKQALLNHHKGASAPSYAEAGMIWLDDSATPWALKLHDGADWIVLGSVNASGNTFQPYAGSAPLKLANYAADTGSANTYAVAPAPALSAYVAEQLVLLKPGNACTGASTLNVSGLGPKNIKLPDGGDTGANALVTTGAYLLMYDGTNFIVANPVLAANYLLARGTTLASAATTDIGGATSDYVEISGTTTITSLGTTAARNHVWVKFQGALVLTHNATSLILPGGANITTAAGDIAEFVRISASNWQCAGYIPASGKALVPPDRNDLPAGALLQVVYATYSTSADLTTVIPNDDTLPQNTEGTEVLTASITPTSATSMIEIEFRGFAGASASTSVISALFKDSGANALCAFASTAGGVNLPNNCGLFYHEISGSTTARTYRIRVGLATGTMRLNGTTTSRLYGGAAVSTLVIREIKA